MCGHRASRPVIADAARFRVALAPIDDEIKAAQFLISAHSKLMTLPQDQRFPYAAAIMRNYGIDLTGQGQQPAQVDPNVQRLEQTVQSLVSAQTQAEERAYNEKRTKVSGEVNSFADEKDEHGALKRPYFNDVAPTIITFLRDGATLQDAYDQAVWANPVTRAKEQARLKTEAEKSLREKSKAESAAAKQASSANVRSRDTRKAPTEPLGKMEDTMKETLAEMRSRTH